MADRLPHDPAALAARQRIVVEQLRAGDRAGYDPLLSQMQANTLAVDKANAERKASLWKRMTTKEREYPSYPGAGDLATAATRTKR